MYKKWSGVKAIREKVLREEGTSSRHSFAYLTSVLTSCVRRKMARACALVAHLIVS